MTKYTMRSSAERRSHERQKACRFQRYVCSFSWNSCTRSSADGRSLRHWTNCKPALGKGSCFSPRNVRRMRDFYRTYENDQTLLRLAMKIGWTLNVVVMEAELTREQQIICFRRAATEKLSKKKLLEIILNKEFADGPIDEPDRTYYNIANPGERRTELTILEPQRCQAKTHRTVKQCTAAERKRDVVQCGRRRRSLILTLYCCVLAFNSPSTVCRFPYFQAWLGSS